MSDPIVTLTLLSGSLAGKEYEFRGPAVYVLGRAEECYPRLPDDAEHMDVSRHHCLLSVNAPEVWIQDLGSKNGTYVNGENVGQRLRPVAEDGALDVHPGNRRRLHDGDEIALGHNTVLRVGVRVLQEAGA